MRDIKFLKKSDEPSLYLGELQADRDHLHPPIYTIEANSPNSGNKPRWSNARHNGDPFNNHDVPSSPNPARWNKSPRAPDPIRSKKAAEVNSNSTNKSGRHSPRVTIRLPNSESKGNDSNNTKSSGASPTSNNANKEEPDVEKSENDKSENRCKRFMGGCCKFLICTKCRKKQNLSEVQLIDEKAKKKRQSSTVESVPKPEEKKSVFSKLKCCKKRDSADNEMVSVTNSKDGMANEPGKPEEAPSPGCLSCCKRKNKIRDSSADRRNEKPASCWQKLKCCCKKKPEEQQDWAARRDSILSQPPPPGTSPGCCGGKLGRIFCCRKAPLQSEDSRRTSLFSKKRSLSQAVPLEDGRPKLDPSLVEHASHIRGAIPALPLPLAWICCIFNVIVPGLGTILSGLFCLCFGRPRFGIYDGARPRIGAFLIDVVVGVGQLFTVLFCLVGWGWSIWWGTMMIKVARKYKKLRLAAEDPERAAPTTNNHRAARA